MNPFRWLVEAIKALWIWWRTSLQVIGDSIIDAVSDVITNGSPQTADVLDQWEPYIAWANHFFPVSETLALGTAFLGLWACLASARMFHRWFFGPAT